jgi:hypothetical protein
MTPSNFMQTKQLNFSLWRLHHSCLVCFKGTVYVGLKTEIMLGCVQVRVHILLQPLEIRNFKSPDSKALAATCHLEGNGIIEMCNAWLSALGLPHTHAHIHVSYSSNGAHIHVSYSSNGIIETCNAWLSALGVPHTHAHIHLSYRSTSKVSLVLLNVKN